MATSPSFSPCYPRAVLGIILSVVLALACNNYPGPGGGGIKSAEARALDDVKEVDNEKQIELSGRQLLGWGGGGWRGGGSKGGWKGGGWKGGWKGGGWKNKGNYNQKYKYKKHYDERECCYTSTSEDCYFKKYKKKSERKKLRKLKSAIKSSGFTFLKPGDECSKYKKNKIFKGHCSCSKVKTRNCFWVNANEGC